MFKLHKITLGFLLFTVALSLGCRKEIEFDVERQREFTVESSFNTGFAFPTPNVKTHSEQTFENHDTRAQLVEDVRLTKMTLKIVDPNDEDFSFLEEIYLRLDAEGETKTLVAQMENISDNVGDSLYLNTTGNKVDSYLKKDEFTLHSEYTTDETLAQDIKIRADMVFHVKAKKEIF